MIPGAAFTPKVVTPVAMSRVHSAVRFAGLMLGLLTVMVLPQLSLPMAVLILVAALRWTGMDASQQVGMLKPWWPMATIVMAVHITTASVAAGELVHDGAVSGLVTLGRIILCLGLLSIFLRVTSLEETIDAVHFWFRPLQVFGVQTRHLGLVLAVALGTAPVVLEEGKRIRAVVRMRQAVPESKGFRGLVSRSWTGLLEWGHIVLPMMESLGRRADTLSLSLATRLPVIKSTGEGPGFVSLMVLFLWLAALIWLALIPALGGWH